MGQSHEEAEILEILYFGDWWFAIVANRMVEFLTNVSFSRLWPH